MAINVDQKRAGIGPLLYALRCQSVTVGRIIPETISFQLFAVARVGDDFIAWFVL